MRQLADMCLIFITIIGVIFLIAAFIAVEVDKAKAKCNENLKLEFGRKP